MKSITLMLIVLLSFGAYGDDSNITADAFFKDKVQHQHILSPNGKFLAYIHNYPSSRTLVITDLDESKVIHNTFLSRPSPYPDNLRWLSNKRLTYNLDGKIYAIDIDGTDIQVLIDNVYNWDEIKWYSSIKKNYKYWWIENILPDLDEDILVKSMSVKGYQSVHRINIYTGEKIDLFDGKKIK